MKHARTRRPATSLIVLAVTAASVSFAPPSRADGLTAGRTTDAATALRSPTELAFLRAASTPSSLRLFGDYFFFDSARSPLEPASGLRASTGLLGPTRSFSLFDAQNDATANQPYLGLGYSKLWLNSQLSINADFGLASQSPGAIGHLRNVFTGAQTLDDAVRELRWSPVMAFNVRYSF